MQYKMPAFTALIGDTGRAEALARRGLEFDNLLFSGKITWTTIDNGMSIAEPKWLNQLGNKRCIIPRIATQVVYALSI